MLNYIRFLPDIASFSNNFKLNDIRERITKFTNDRIPRTWPTDVDMKKDKCELDARYPKQIMETITGEKTGGLVDEGACRGRRFFRRAEFDTPLDNYAAS